MLVNEPAGRMVKNGLGMFASKDDNFAAAEDRLQCIDKPPTQFRYNGDFFKTESREMHASCMVNQPF